MAAALQTMPKPLNSVLAQIAAGKPPATLLVGGTSDYLSEQAFRDLRDAIVAANPSIALQTFEPGTELASILDSYRTLSLFSAARLLIVPEVNAFVSAKELTSLYEKALGEWKSAKTDRKRTTASAKLLHVLGLVGADLDMTDRQIADALGVSPDGTLADMLAFCRNSGKKAGRGEGDAALLTEAIARGGAPGTILLLRTGEIPRESATVELIDRHGAVVACDVTRESFAGALDAEIQALASEADVRFDALAEAAAHRPPRADELQPLQGHRGRPPRRLSQGERHRAPETAPVPAAQEVGGGARAVGGVALRGALGSGGPGHQAEIGRRAGGRGVGDVLVEVLTF